MSSSRVPAVPVEQRRCERAQSKQSRSQTPFAAGRHTFEEDKRSYNKGFMRVQEWQDGAGVKQKRGERLVADRDGVRW